MQLKRRGEPSLTAIPEHQPTPIVHGDIFTLYYKKHPIRVLVVPKEVKTMDAITPGLCVWFKHPGYPYWPARIAKVYYHSFGVLFMLCYIYLFFLFSFSSYSCYLRKLKLVLGSKGKKEVLSPPNKMKKTNLTHTQNIKQRQNKQQTTNQNQSQLFSDLSPSSISLPCS